MKIAADVFATIGSFLHGFGVTQPAWGLSYISMHISNALYRKCDHD